MIQTKWRVFGLKLNGQWMRMTMKSPHNYQSDAFDRASLTCFSFQSPSIRRPATLCEEGTNTDGYCCDDNCHFIMQISTQVSYNGNILNALYKLAVSHFCFGFCSWMCLYGKKSGLFFCWDKVVVIVPISTNIKIKKQKSYCRKLVMIKIHQQ